MNGLGIPYALPRHGCADIRQNRLKRLTGARRCGRRSICAIGINPGASRVLGCVGYGIFLGQGVACPRERLGENNKIRIRGALA